MWFLVMLPPMAMAFFEKDAFDRIPTLATRSVPLALALGALFVMASHALQLASIHIRRGSDAVSSAEIHKSIRGALLAAAWIMIAFFFWLLVGKPHYW